MSPDKPPVVHLPSIIAAKNPRLARRMPSFLVNYLNRIVHVDEINQFLELYPNVEGVPFVEAAIDFLGIQYTQTGFDNLSTHKRYLFVSNHPLGGLDGLTLMHCASRKYPIIYFLANDILCNLPPLRQIFLPVNKHGSQNSEYLKELHDAYQSDAQVFTFPAGLFTENQRQGARSEVAFALHKKRCSVRTRYRSHPLFRTQLSLLLQPGSMAESARH